MRIVALLFLVSVAACTVYQSDGRQAIEKNKANIVGTFGFDIKTQTHYSCFISADTPSVLQTPNEVIENEFEKDGFSSQLHMSDEGPQLVIYKYDADRSQHHYCTLKTLDNTSAAQTDAIRLAVDLLIQQISKFTTY